MIRRLRLATGLVLFVYVATHLLNHALGIVSLAAMEQGRGVFLAIWRNPVGTTLLYGALAIHLALAGWALYARRSLRMPLGEGVQIVLGFAVPLILALHIVGTRGAAQLAGTNDSYVYVLLAQWKFSDTGTYLQSAGMLAAWIHGCIGLYYWLRLKRPFRQVQPLA